MPNYPPGTTPEQLHEERAEQARRVTQGYEIRELEAMPDGALGHALRRVHLLEGALLDLVVFGSVACGPEGDDPTVGIDILRVAIKRARILLKGVQFDGIPTEAEILARRPEDA